MILISCLLKYDFYKILCYPSARLAKNNKKKWLLQFLEVICRGFSVASGMKKPAKKLQNVTNFPAMSVDFW